MSIKKWSPLNEMDTIMRDMDRILSEIFPIQRRYGTTAPPDIEVKDIRVASPALDMIDRKDSILVRVEMPGIKK